MKKLTTLFLTLAIVITSIAQPDPDYYAANDKEMQQKYWKYRDQLRKYFMKVGLEGGESIPCRARNHGFLLGQQDPFSDPDNVPMKSTMKWADSTIDMGYYLALLATEYKLLSNHEEDVQPTLNELFYALAALERLDYVAEEYLSQGQNILSYDDVNGLLIRDDIPGNFWLNFQDDLSLQGEEMKIERTNSDFYGWTENGGTAEQVTFNDENVQSLDQLVTIFSGLVTVYELVDHTETVLGITGADIPKNLVDMAKGIAQKIVDRLEEHDWKILTWDENNFVPRGRDVTWSAPAFMAAAHRMGLSNYLTLLDNTIPLKVSEFEICNFLNNCDGESSDWWIAANLIPLVGIWNLTHCDAFEEGCGDDEPVNPLFIPVNVEYDNLAAAWASADEYNSDISIDGNGTICLKWPIDITLTVPPVSVSVEIPIKWCFIRRLLTAEDGLNAVNVHMMHELGMSSNIWSTEYIHDHTRQYDHLPHLGLWSAVLNGGQEHLDNKQYYFDLLKSAPCTSPFANTWDSGIFAPDGWAIANRFVSPGSAYSGAIEEDDVTPTKDVRGEFPGLDYMLLYNLYHLNFENEMPQGEQFYTKNPSCECILDITAENSASFDFLDPDQAVLATDLTIVPKFPDYHDKGIEAPTFLSRNAEVNSGATLRLEEDLIICNESTLRITQGSSLVVQEGRQIIVKEGSSIVVEDGAKLLLERNEFYLRPSLVLNDNTNLSVNDAQIISRGLSRIIIGNSSVISLTNANINFGLDDGIVGLEATDFYVGSNVLFSSSNTTIICESSSSFHFGDGLVWNSQQDALIGLSELSSPLFFVGEEAQIDFDDVLELHNSSLQVDNNGDVELLGCDVTLTGRSLLSTDRYTDVHWDAGTALHLNGEQSVFEIGGMVKIHDAATFTFDYSSPQGGHIRIMEDGEEWYEGHFEPMAEGASIYLEGADHNDLVLELGHSADFGNTNPDLMFEIANMTFKYGRIEMDENSRINLSCNESRFLHVDLIGASRGVSVYHKNKFTECLFQGDGNGITGRMNYSNAYPLIVQRSDFEQGAYIQTQGTSYSVSDCNFSDAFKGIGSYDLTLPSYVHKSNFDQVQYPVWDEASQTILKLYYNTFNYGNTPDWDPGDNVAVAKSYGQLNLKCNEFNGFGTAAKAEYTSIVQAGVMSYGGYNSFGNNNIDIDLGYFQKGDGDELKLDIYHGYNDFLDHRPGDKYIIGSLGDSEGPTGSAGFNYWRPERNHWGDMTSPQVLPGTSVFENLPAIPNPERFSVCLYGGYTGPPSWWDCTSDEIYAIDDDPWTSNTMCGSHDDDIKLDKTLGTDKGKIHYLSTAVSKSLEDSTLADPIIYTNSFDSVATSDAILFASSLIEFYNDSTGNNMEAITLFKEILLYDYDTLASDVNWMLDIAYSKMKTSVEHAFALDSISAEDNLADFHPKVQDYVDVLMCRSADVVNDSNYVEQFYLELDKAQFFRVLGKYELGHQLLLNLDNCPIDSIEQAQLNELIFVSEQDILMKQAGIGVSVDSLSASIDTTLYTLPTPLEADEFYFGAQILGVDQVSYTNCGLVTWKSPIGSGNRREFFVYPNPTSGVLTIAYEQRKDEQLTFQLRDLNGRIMNSYPLSGKEGMAQIDISGLPDGAYPYVIMNSKKVLESGQVVKQR